MSVSNADLKTESRMERHERYLITMRAYLAGRQNYLASQALEFTRRRMTGLRKDGMTPAFHHPLSVAHFIRTLPKLIYSDESMAAAFLHDVLEDFGDSISKEDLRKEFGETVAEAVWVLSKKSNGLVKTPDLYFTALAENPIASIVKAADRLHNLHTMEGAFSIEKQMAYVAETRERFFPMIRKAGNTFPEQFDAYDNVKIALNLQIQPIERLCRFIMEKSDDPC